MRKLCAVLAAVSLPLLLVGHAPGQKGVFVPRPPPLPPVRPPVTPFVPPVVPHHHPVTKLPALPNSNPATTHHPARALDTTAFAILAARTIGLMAPIDGDGALLAATTLVESEMRRAQGPDSLARARILLRDSAVLAGGTVGFMTTADGDGALLTATTLVEGEMRRAQGPDSVARARILLRDSAVLSAGTVGLLTTADGDGALLASSALVGRETSRAPRPGPILAPQGHIAEPAAPATNLAAWVIAAVVIFGLLVVAIAVAVSRRAGRVRVCIVDVPPGEAPDYIRRAWVGLELPLAPGQTGPVALATMGVVSGRQDGVMVGYVVLGSEAVKLLAARDPDTALWWRTHAPHVLARGYLFAFPTEVCDRV
jgi:hypothetical protein